MGLSVGTQLGPYEVVSLLGAGGMGEVYRARDTRLDREVAVKTISPEHAADPSALARFEREARAVAALSHSNILAIHDVGTHEGLCFIVTELLEGETLRKRLDRSALPWRKAVEIAAAVAEGLSAAHSRGVVHRDLKPENVFLATNDRVKILDFGLALRTPLAGAGDDSRSPTMPHTTTPGQLVGTISYMSPEQIQGRTVDARSDIFSLGAVLYEMISGRQPFRGETAVETITAILRDEPAPPSGSGAEVPPDLQRVVLHCLEKNPEERFQSARDLAFDLKALSSGPIATGAAAGARPEAIDTLLVLPLVNASTDSGTEYLSDGITESLIYSLSRLPGLKVMARSTAFRYKGREVDPCLAGRELNVRAVLTGRVTQRGDSLLIRTELVDVANGWQLWGERYNRRFEDVFAVQDEIAQEISEKLQLKLTGEARSRLAKRQTQDPEAYQLYLRGRHHWNKRSEEGLRKGIDCFRRAIDRDPTYALPYVGLADSHNIMGYYDYVAPLDAFPKAKAAAAKALELDDTLAEAHASLAYATHYHDWNWPAAERAFQRAIELDGNYATAHHFYATHLAGRGRFDEAFREIERARRLDPLSLIINAGLGLIHYLARDYERALEECRKVIDMDPAFIQAYIWLAWTCQQTGSAAEGVEQCRKALQVSGGGVLALAEVGRALAASGQTEEAENVLEELSELAKRRYVSPLAQAEIYVALGRSDDAFSWLTRACEERSALLTFLSVDPKLDALRSDPRFTAVSRRVAPAPATT